MNEFSLKWPNEEVIRVTDDVDFVYIMRKDADYTINPIAKRMHENSGRKSLDELQQILKSSYDNFFYELTDIMSWGYSSYGNFEIHVYDPNQLDSKVREKLVGENILSLDPLMVDGVHSLEISRGYYPSGRKDFGQVERPGSDSIDEQLASINENITGEVAIAEDDVFSGSSIIRSALILANHNIKIKKVVPGIQVGNPESLKKENIDVDPVIKYDTESGDPFEKIDLGDPRDYFIGGSGLVIKLPNGSFGRVPYILPFISPNIRAGIPKDKEFEFSIRVIEANKKLFENVKANTGIEMLLDHMDLDFKRMMVELYGMSTQTDMITVCKWAEDRIEEKWELSKQIGETEQAIDSLKIKPNVVFLDLNGVIIPEESPDGKLSEEQLSLLNAKVKKLNAKGYDVGVCSDSPLLQLQDYISYLGISGPIIAENGNIISNNGVEIAVQKLDNIESIKNEIEEYCNENGYIREQNDRIAAEFGGGRVDEKMHGWAFGANRKSSISLFGNKELISKLGDYLKSKGYNVDCSPEYNFLSIHPNVDFKKNKSRALSLLSNYGHNLIMIGNTMSDWSNPKDKIATMFVGDANISEYAKRKAIYISNKPNTEGAIDILDKICQIGD